MIGRGRRHGWWLVALALAMIGARVQAGSHGVLDDLTEGRWLEILDSKLIDVAPRESPGGSTLKIVAWSGGAYDSRRDLFLVWGGGHSDYAGNEVYAFDLASRKWRRLTEPSVADRARTPAYPDGQPRARHTYNYIEYVPSIDRLFGKPVIRGTRLTVELLLRAAIVYAADTVARERHSKIGRS